MKKMSSSAEVKISLYRHCPVNREHDIDETVTLGVDGKVEVVSQPCCGLPTIVSVSDPHAIRAEWDTSPEGFLILRLLYERKRG